MNGATIVSEDSDRPILVTGANGQVGHELLRVLQGLAPIVGADRAMVDLADAPRLRDAVRAIRPALIVNAGAYTAVDRADTEFDLAMRINGEAPGVLAQEARRLGVPLIHYSTDYVFDGEKDGAYYESDATNPQNAYGRTKLVGEQAVAASGADHLILRTSWVYGTRGRNFMLTMLRLGAQRPELDVVADQIGAPTWSNTIAALTAHIVAQARAASEPSQWWRERRGIYHLTAGGSTSWHGFASAIFELRADETRPAVRPIAAAAYPSPVKRPANSCLSCDKLAAVFGLRAPEWRDALALCLAELARPGAL